MYNKTKRIEGLVTTDDPKNMAATVQSHEFKDRITIRFSDFRVADWWLAQHDIPRQYSHSEFDQITAMGVAAMAPFTDQPDKIQIKGIYVQGQYFSKETLYGTLLLFWALLLGSEAFCQYWSLNRRIARDAKKLQTLSEISAKYKIKAETDKLTGLSNREGLAQTLKMIEQRQNKEVYALLLIDVDNFKKLNDQYGHDVGDVVLEQLAQLMNSGIRSTDLVCRWGGEEFIILFHLTHSEDILMFAEKIRLQIAATPFAGELELNVTVSIGAAVMKQGESFDISFKAADQALYAAKRGGRNQTIVA